MQKNTKIVATIGPATESEDILTKLISEGMNIARFNTKHSDPSWHNDRIKRVVTVSKKLKTPVGVLLDLQGPEIRINLPGEKSFDVKRGELVTFTSDESSKEDNRIFIPQQVIESLDKENLILLEDGACEFYVFEKNGTSLTAQALLDCTVNHRKTMNTPGVILEMPSLTERDITYLDGVKPENIDYVGLSFVRRKSDIEVLREELDERNIKADIIAKIENQSALDNIDEIIEVSDAIMIARGDLGVEVPYEELIHWQKTIIEKCRKASKPVITATEMLKSMVNSPRPTRAEVSDVAHAIYDGTDAVMLSDETTIGKYPVKAVAVQRTIAEYNEKLTNLTNLDLGEEELNSSACITRASVNVAYASKLKVDRIVCLTETGRTAKYLARFRPKAPVEAITSNEATAKKLALLFGVSPHIIEMPEKELKQDDSLLELFKEKGIIQTGETILLIHGTFWKTPGLTNTLSIITVT